MTKEYCIEQDRYGVITQNVSRVTEELYGEQYLHGMPKSKRKPAGQDCFKLKLRGYYKIVDGREKDAIQKKSISGTILKVSD